MAETLVLELLVVDFLFVYFRLFFAFVLLLLFCPLILEAGYLALDGLKTP
jgi:hypothetical protein